MRKGAHEAVNKVVASDLNGYQTYEALMLARSGLEDPTSWDGCLRHAAASLMLSFLYGERSVGFARYQTAIVVAEDARLKANKTPAFTTSTHSTNN